MVEVSYNPYQFYSNQFIIMGIPVEAIPSVRVKKSLIEEINVLQSNLVSKRELSRVKT